MSLELIDSELNKVQFELNRLSELSNQINDCQNEMRYIQNELKNDYERDRKFLLDLRLKFGKKIEEAKHYYHAISELEMEQGKQDRLQAQLNENQQKLNTILSEITPDITGLKCNQIKNLREKINQIKLNSQFQSVQCISKAEKVSKLKNKYSRSIDATKIYFSSKAQSNERVNELIELLNKCQSNLALYKTQYSTHMTNLEEISTEIHLQRATQNLVDSRLNEPMPNCECLSIPSYNFEDDEKFNSGYSINFEDNPCDDSNEDLSNNLSHSQSHLYGSSICNDGSSLPSPCKSINLPLGYSTGIIVKKTKNLTWHPLL